MASNFFVADGAALMSGRDDWETPQALFDKLDAVHHFTLDPCSTHENAKCAKHYTRENAKCAKHYTREDDGLAQSWAGEVVFCNPPYGRNIGAWVRKCAEESTRARVVLLIPARTDTRYFHDYIYRKPDVQVDFLRGRLKFERGGWPSTRPLRSHR